jgi:IS30 family transposase
MQKWRDILINFIVDLLSSNRFTNIIVVVDRLTKMRYIILIKSIDAISVAKCFVKYVFKLHRLPNLIISDRRSQFILNF